MGDWFGVVLDVLYLLNHSFNAIFMHDGLWVYGWFIWVDLCFICSIWPSMRPWSLVYVMWLVFMCLGFVLACFRLL